MDYAPLFKFLSSRYNIPYRENHSHVAIRCPFHDDVNPSLSISRYGEYDVGYCFGCQKSYWIRDIIEEITGEDANEVSNDFDIYFDNEEDDIDYSWPRIYTRKPIEDLHWEYQDYTEAMECAKWYHPYLQTRKISMETARKFGVGYDAKTDCVTFPIFDINNQLITTTRRSVTTKMFKLEKGIPKPIYLLNAVNHLGSIPFACVCESQIDALNLWEWGYPSIALLGCGNKSQYKYIDENSKVSRWYMCFDGDKAGEKACTNWKYYFGGDCSTRVNIPQGKDINDLTKEEFDNLFNQVRRIDLY